MSYPSGHTFTANDGIEALTASIANSLDIQADAGDGQAQILAKIATAAQAAAGGGVGSSNVTVNGSDVLTNPTAAELLAANPGLAARTPITKTSTYAAVAGDYLLPDVSGGSFTVTLPAALTGAPVVLVGVKGADATHILTVARNGNNLAGSAADLTFDIGLPSTFIPITSYGWFVPELQ